MVISLLLAKKISRKHSDENNSNLVRYYLFQCMLLYFRFVFYVNGNEVITDVTANDDQWHHIALTWTSDGGTWKVYGDGQLQDEGQGLGAGHTIQGNGD